VSTSRALTALVAGFMATAVSMDPRLPAPAEPAEPASPAAAPEAPPIAPAGEAPRDVELEITPDGRGAHRVVVRRRGFLVSLRDEGARAAGKDWTMLRIAPGEGQGGAAGRLVWETTRLDGLQTDRGLLDLTGDGASLSGTLRAALPPAPAASWKDGRATCSGLHDGLGGFTVLCRFAAGVRVTGVANVTGARSLDDAWLVTGPAGPLVRLDLPAARGGAEARVVGMVHGATGAVLRAEATFFEGEAPALTLGVSERVQPVL
jgi:hypothetical protein